MATSNRHRFGGSWTELKLDAISDYLAFYNGALQYKPSPSNPFERWYFDAFAGSGERVETRPVGGLWDGIPAGTEEVTRDGSARRAIAVNPPFHHLVFIERDAGRFQALRGLENEFPNRGVQCLSGDANELLLKIFTAPPWSLQRGGKGRHRGVVFLDPYALDVKWNTLRVLAETGSLDVWYLFPLNAVVRQLAHDYKAVDEAKKAALNEIFGTADWQSQLYAHEVRRNLFDEVVEESTRVATQGQIEAYAKSRLETLFNYVSEPLPLLLDRGAQMFSLFCASGTDSKLAKPLIEKGVASVLKKYAGASHRKWCP